MRVNRMFTSYLRYNHKAYGIIEVNETRMKEFQFEFIVDLSSKLFYEVSNADTIVVYDNPRKLRGRRRIELNNVKISGAEIKDVDACIYNIDTRILARIKNIRSCMIIKVKCTGYDIKFEENKKRKIYKKLWLR